MAADTHLSNFKRTATWLLCLAVMVHAANLCPQQCMCNNNFTQVTCEFRNLTSLPLRIPTTATSLNVRGNSLKSITKDSQLDNLYNLKFLNLTENLLQTIEPDCFRPHSALQSLDLSYNDIQVVDDTTFEGLNNVKVLKLNNNPNLCLDYGSMTTLPSLEELDLGNTQIIFFTGIFQQSKNVVLKIPQNLTSLKLWNTQLRTIPEKPLFIMKNLTFLDLSQNLITKVDQSSFIGNGKLRYLDLAYNPIQIVHQNAFLNLINLESLFLDETRTLKTLPNGTLRSLPFHASVCLYGNNWHCDCNLLWLRKWFEMDNRTYCAQKPICRTPKKLEGAPLNQVPPTQFVCSKNAYQPQNENNNINRRAEPVVQPGYCTQKTTTPLPTTRISFNTTPYKRTITSKNISFIVPLFIVVFIIIAVLFAVLVRYLRLKKKLHDQNKYFNISYDTGSQVHLAESPSFEGTKG